MNKGGERNSSIELLRIFAIFIIILNHYALYSGFAFENNVTFANMIPKWLHIGGKLGVDIFIFISGYFLCEGNKFRIKKLAKIVLEVFFYGLILIALGLIMKNLHLKYAIKLFFAIPTMCWEFITMYVMLYIFSPYINIMLERINIKDFLKLMIITTLVWVVFPSFFKFEFGITYSILWYIYIYILAAFIKRIENKLPIRPKTYIIIGSLSVGVIAILELFIKYIGINYISILEKGVEHFRQYNSIFVLISMISFFLGFKQLKVKNIKFINIIASTSLAVFIMHDNDILRNWLWKDVFKSASFQYSKLLIPHAIGSCLAIFICFAIVDLLRQRLIEKPLMNFLTPKIERLEKWYDNKIEVLSRKLS